MGCNCNACIWNCKFEEGYEDCSHFTPESEEELLLEMREAEYNEYREAWLDYTKDFD